MDLRSDSEQTIGEGRWTDVSLPRGGLRKVGRLECSLSAVRRASRLTLTVSIPGTPYANDWQIWVYPPTLDTAPSLLQYMSGEQFAPATSVPLASLRRLLRSRM